MVTSNGAVTSVLVSFYCYDKYHDQRHEEEKVGLTLSDHIPSLWEFRAGTQADPRGNSACWALDLCLAGFLR